MLNARRGDCARALWKDAGVTLWWTVKSRLACLFETAGPPPIYCPRSRTIVPRAPSSPPLAARSLHAERMTGAGVVGSRAHAGRFPCAFNGAVSAVDGPACCHFKRLDWPGGGGRASPPPLYKEGSGRNGVSQPFAICLSPFLLPPFFCYGEGAWRCFIGGGEGLG